jgi:hypothetical protein
VTDLAALEQQRFDATSAQLAADREPGRACPHDDDVGVHGVVVPGSVPVAIVPSVQSARALGFEASDAGLLAEPG